MAYFSRLTDIVTCNLSHLLEEADDPQAALADIIREMEDGIAGARRSMKTAAANEDRIRADHDEHSKQVSYWATKAREALTAGQEDQARLALVRKREAEHLIASLLQQLEAAVSTREHLTTTFRALEARLADAQRRNALLQATGNWRVPETTVTDAGAAHSQLFSGEIDDELAALKRELGQ